MLEQGLAASVPTRASMRSLARHCSRPLPQGSAATAKRLQGAASAPRHGTLASSFPVTARLLTVEGRVGRHRVNPHQGPVGERGRSGRRRPARRQRERRPLPDRVLCVRGPVGRQRPGHPLSESCPSRLPQACPTNRSWSLSLFDTSHHVQMVMELATPR